MKVSHFLLIALIIFLGWLSVIPLFKSVEIKVYRTEDYLALKDKSEYNDSLYHVHLEKCAFIHREQIIFTRDGYLKLKK